MCRETTFASTSYHMIRFIFYTLIAYVLFKIFRVFIDPLFDSGARAPKPQTGAQDKPSQATPKEPVLGEYVEYEEIK